MTNVIHLSYHIVRNNANKNKTCYKIVEDIKDLIIIRNNN